MGFWSQCEHSASCSVGGTSRESHHLQETEKFAAQKDAAPTAAEAKSLEECHEEKLKIEATAEAATAEKRSRTDAIPVSSVQILHRLHFVSRLERMSVIVDVEAKAGTAEAALRGKYALVKGSAEAVGALFAEDSALPWYETAYLELAEQGCRVFALALRQLGMPMLMLPSCPGRR